MESQLCVSPLRLKVLYAQQDGDALLHAPDSSSWKKIVFLRGFLGFVRSC